MNKTRIKCPLCEWIYDIKPVSLQAADPMALASVFGPGVFSAHAFASQARDTEEALEKHFATHKTVEWVTKVSRLESALKRFIDAANSWHELHHATSPVQCDWFCELIPVGAFALQDASEVGK